MCVFLYVRDVRSSADTRGVSMLRIGLRTELYVLAVQHRRS